MMLYYMTKSKGRAGCSSSTWRKTDSFSSKAELKRYFKGLRTITYIYTEAQLDELPEETSRIIRDRAIAR